MIDSDSLPIALDTLGAILEDRGQPHDLAVIGGGALLLLGLIERPTKDLDVVARLEARRLVRAEPFPADLVQAVEDVASALGLPHDWLNPGPASLVDLGLPEGFLDRATVQHRGALTLRIAARTDQIGFKLYAAVDQGPRSKHFADLRRLDPRPEELAGAARWCVSHDPSEGFREMLRQALAALGVVDVDA